MKKMVNKFSIFRWQASTLSGTNFSHWIFERHEFSGWARWTSSSGNFLDERLGGRLADFFRLKNSLAERGKLLDQPVRGAPDELHMERLRTASLDESLNKSPRRAPWTKFADGIFRLVSWKCTIDDSAGGAVQTPQQINRLSFLFFLYHLECYQNSVCTTDKHSDDRECSNPKLQSEFRTREILLRSIHSSIVGKLIGEHCILILRWKYYNCLIKKCWRSESIDISLPTVVRRTNEQMNKNNYRTSNNWKMDKIIHVCSSASLLPLNAPRKRMPRTQISRTRMTPHTNVLLRPHSPLRPRIAPYCTPE